MPTTSSATRERIRELNDALRTSFDPKLGRFVLTSGVDSLPSDVRAMVIRKVATFDAFTPDNDPHGEHDFGNFEVAGRKFFFKIDYYAPDLDSGSEDPADSKKTARVLTTLFASGARTFSRHCSSMTKAAASVTSSARTKIPRWH